MFTLVHKTSGLALATRGCAEAPAGSLSCSPSLHTPQAEPWTTVSQVGKQVI